MRLTPLEQWIMNKTGIKERDKNALVDYQLAKIRETMSYAKKNSIFYGKLLKNVREESVYSQESFQNIPFTYPQDIMRSPLDFLCVPQRKVARIVT